MLHSANSCPSINKFIQPTSAHQSTISRTLRKPALEFLTSQTINKFMDTAKNSSGNFGASASSAHPSIGSWDTANTSSGISDPSTSSWARPESSTCPLCSPRPWNVEVQPALVPAHHALCEHWRDHVTHTLVTGVRSSTCLVSRRRGHFFNEQSRGQMKSMRKLSQR